MKALHDLKARQIGPLPDLQAPPPEESGRGLELMGLVLSFVWAGLVLGFILASDPGEDEQTLGLLTTLLMVFLPIVLIWVVVIPLRSVRALRTEAARLQATVEAMRTTYVQTQSQQPTGGQGKSVVERRIDEIAAATRQAESVLATFVSQRGAASRAQRRPLPVVAPDPAVEQPALALGEPQYTARAPLTVQDVIRALNFPDSATDREGFRALRSALADYDMAKLIRAAQDVLTLLSQDGIYMDDLIPQMPQAEVWRRFAGGERGRSISELGGIRDRSALALTNTRMKSDPVFRDAAHHFLRSFDRGFAMIEPSASDQDLAALSDTRSARAFMLLGRVSGTFE